MRNSYIVIFIWLISTIINVQSTCVLESDFGFSINCNFKKSSLFRVRNLGGLKAYIGLGFSLGDELGFPESLSNTEAENRKRALNYKTIRNSDLLDNNGPILRSRPQAVTSPKQMEQFKTKSSVPSFRPLPRDTLQLNSSQKYELPEIDLKGYSIEELAAFANVSVDVIKAAIKIRQQQLKSAEYNSDDNSVEKSKITTKSSIFIPLPKTTFAPRNTLSVTKFTNTKNHKIMNAPKEYYPAGYDKNFDDNFKSKIDLPATSFHCGDQKHFPGLYADDDLGCMVFHVCALTDDGLVMKSFLCPESTLFDQTILKCNWWFYTDCKSSKTLYDSNLPVSKSYQLMKSLAFFNTNYKKSINGTDRIDIKDLKNSLQA